MYTQSKTVKQITLINGEVINPVASLISQHGSQAHIVIDDNCYVLVHDAQKSGRFKMVTHIFPEAFRVMKNLPKLN